MEALNPLRDIETINLELIFSDLEILERRIAKVAKGARMDKEQAKELAMLERVKERLEDGKLAIGFETEDEDEEEYFKNLNLLTAKPVIYAANVGEEDLANDGADNRRSYRQSENMQKKPAVRYLRSAHRSRKKFPSWTMMRTSDVLWMTLD